MFKKAFIIPLALYLPFSLTAGPTSAANALEVVPVIHETVIFENQRMVTDELSEAAEADLIKVVETIPVVEIIEKKPAAKKAEKTDHGFDVAAAIALAESEVGSSRPTGWSQPGECIMSAQRWILAGGGAWTGSGNPVANYVGAKRLPVSEALPGDIIQYEYIASPTSWVSGVHTLMITGVNDDGTFTIIESNNPGGSGLVSKDEAWTPTPPPGFQAVAWRF